MKKKHMIIVSFLLIFIGIIILYYIIPIKKTYDIPLEYTQIYYENVETEQSHTSLSKEAKKEFIDVFNNNKLKHRIKSNNFTYQYKPYDFEINLYQEFFPTNEYLPFKIKIKFFHDFNLEPLNASEREKKLENYPTSMPIDNWTAFIIIDTKHGTSNYQFADESTTKELVKIIKDDLYETIE